MTHSVKRAGLAAAILLAAALGLAACGQSGGPSASNTQIGLYERPEDRAIGDPDAPVTVIEYASVTCTACKAWHDLVWPDFKEQLVDTGKVRFVFREMPTAPEEVAMAGFLVARAAPEERYFAVIDTLFARQDRLIRGDRRAELLAIARAAGLSEAEFEQCLRDEDEIARIAAWRDEARDVHGIRSTPGFVINGVPQAPGALPLAVFEQAVAEAEG